MKTAITFKTLPKSYQGLMETHMLRPVHDAVDHANATDMLETMAGHKLSAEQEDYFEALSTLVEAYEQQRIQEPKVTGVDLLRHLVEANEMSAADLSRLLGKDRSLGVRILNGERQLTVEHIKTLASHFGLPAQMFLE